MKIAYVYDAIYPYTIGGVEKRIATLSERLVARGHEIHIIGLKSWENEPYFFRKGIHYHGVGSPKVFYTSSRRSVSEALYFGYNVISPLIQDRYDIIDCQNFPYFSCFSSAFASRIRGSRLVVTWHEVWLDYWYDYLGVKGSFGRVIEKCTAKLSDNLVAVSESTRSDLNRLNPHASIELIPNGIDFQQIDAVKPAAYSSDIIFTGRLIREKKADLLIDALVLIKKEIPGIRCVVIGDGPEKEGLFRLCKKYHLENNLLFTGFVQNHNEVLALMKASKIFISPSVREGFGMAALEALACGLPVVTGNSPKNAVKELVTHKTGIISDLSPDSFAEAFLTCLKNKNSMTEECKTQSMSYDWKKIVSDVEGYYSRV